MSGFLEIDFWSVEADKSGDAISLRYREIGVDHIIVVDGGFQKTGESLVENIREVYDDPDYIDHVVATHPDGDHAGGLREVLQNFSVGMLWMHRPWL
ncbi:MAG: MBL fold metallo-hydrolase [Hyphomonas sp.]|uniref:MBL fold metallo-hydrolase n=1 Tax=Hyphomonas sp. TaxID=87 RepID=UPI0017F9198F|nr:MBL fold metallo-hydrolase [Hyphomonas sp.]MBU3920434.1 MBL fold metallo-hydrolase [Alphaproteobacteria bacterium]MBA3069342.1 MBL fold metallo-hydrolase [Hyphomonas sp.]MBU4063724.1 MBL fold metallo-hydrolase [Alphaproteobacteria bacterium]MBU4164315.1 MBL fold metallo-hydrolase [Alphaproteobacteria bacterium]MBU4568772.1 MBL fold metallo-hydrolase [Alphaproteobacteria bacterium]